MPIPKDWLSAAPEAEDHVQCILQLFQSSADPPLIENLEAQLKNHPEISI